jgi:hypothetical protein
VPTTTTVVYVLLASAIATSAALDLARYRPIYATMDRLGIPRWWLPWLGAFKAAAAAGLAVGLFVPAVGIATAATVVVFFIGAVGAHLRVDDHAVAPAVGYGLLAVIALTAGLITT